MSDQMTQEQRYMVSVHELKEAPGTLVFTLVPKVSSRNAELEGLRSVCQNSSLQCDMLTMGPAFDWSGTADDPGVAREEVETKLPLG